MADRHTKIKPSQFKDFSLTKQEINAEGETEGHVLTVQSGGYVGWEEPTHNIASIEIVADGGGSVINTGVVADIEIDFDCEIQKVTLLADQTGSIQFDILKDTYANYPPTTSITASAKPTITSSNKNQDTTLTGWTKSISAGDILRIQVDSVATITRCLLGLKVKRNI